MVNQDFQEKAGLGRWFWEVVLASEPGECLGECFSELPMLRARKTHWAESAAKLNSNLVKSRTSRAASS